MIEVFRKVYDSDSIVDVDRDMAELPDEILARNDVPKNDKGLLDGTIELIVIVHPAR